MHHFVQPDHSTVFVLGDVLSLYHLACCSCHPRQPGAVGWRSEQQCWQYRAKRGSSGSQWKRMWREQAVLERSCATMASGRGARRLCPRPYRQAVPLAALSSCLPPALPTSPSLLVPSGAASAAAVLLPPAPSTAPAATSAALDSSAVLSAASPPSAACLAASPLLLLSPAASTLSLPPALPAALPSLAAPAPSSCAWGGAGSLA